MKIFHGGLFAKPAVETGRIVLKVGRVDMLLHLVGGLDQLIDQFLVLLEPFGLTGPLAGTKIRLFPLAAGREKNQRKKGRRDGQANLYAVSFHPRETLPRFDKTVFHHVPDIVRKRKAFKTQKRMSLRALGMPRGHPFSFVRQIP